MVTKNNFFLMRLVGIIGSFLGVSLILFGGLKTPENFRILSDIIQNILILNIVILVFFPDKKIMMVALLIGLFTMFLDYILETMAVYLHWWFPLGGIQFPPLLVIPLEMLLSFFIIGSSMGIILFFPERMRSIRKKPFKPLAFLFKNPNHDLIWRLLLIFINAIIGTHGDYSAGPSIWRPGPSWQPFYTFMVWFGGGLLTLFVFSKVKDRIVSE